MPAALDTYQNMFTAQTISAVPAAVYPEAQGDGEFRQTAADFLNAKMVRELSAGGNGIRS